MKVYTLTNEQLNEQVNICLEGFLEDICKEGEITVQKKEELSKYRVVIHHKGFFGRMFDKFFKKESNTVYSTVKII